ncbi:nicotinamide riboside transporter PnuC [Aquabacterium sp.]|uniref:nicotinamide riboside transporter PnuC n=1 Tax=Aquabacterium sp. TaxID=1872578 RepID=UPI002C161D08|nr:nicotinamide riboside transporter PnuC [Aquabacterium sp.]HSW08701.1 nicotinamide riboside transporter PnuC [Aquabacterium sp.]
MGQAWLDAAQRLLGVALTEAFVLWGSAITWLEIVACVLSVWMVVCNMRVNPLAWPLAMLASLLYGLLFANSRLYGEASLQLLFIVVAGWGWWQWLRGTGAAGEPLRVHTLRAAQRWQALALTLAAWPLLGLLLARVTDTDVPYLDALPTVGSITGQFLLGRKLVENWPVWVIVNLVSIGLFAYKGLWLTVLLYAVFTVMAVAGWRAWLRLTIAR